MAGACVTGLAIALLATPVAGDWSDDWAVAPGFSLSLDSEGFDFPSAIAMVPEPGPDPKDPRYFVTELRGKVSVVANDGSVHTFASDFHSFEPRQELPQGFEGQGGLAGICLDPVNGYVFVTFIYRAAGNAIRNGLVRFDSRPGRFSLEPEATLDLRELFAPDDGGVTHQIGWRGAPFPRIRCRPAAVAQRPMSSRTDSAIPLASASPTTASGSPRTA
jgi:hypothetical protein